MRIPKGFELISSLQVIDLHGLTPFQTVVAGEKASKDAFARQIRV
jgi:hypothetical protein